MLLVVSIFKHVLISKAAIACYRRNRILKKEQSVISVFNPFFLLFSFNGCIAHVC